MIPASRFAASTLAWLCDSRKMVTRCASGEPPPWMSEMVSALSMAIFSISRNILTRFSTGTLLAPLQVLLQELPISGILEIPVGGQIRDEAAAISTISRIASASSFPSWILEALARTVSMK